MPEQLITFHFKMESAGNPAMPRIGMQTTNCAMQAIRLIPFLIAVVSHKKTSMAAICTERHACFCLYY